MRHLLTRDAGGSQWLMRSLEKHLLVLLEITVLNRNRKNFLISYYYFNIDTFQNIDVIQQCIMQTREMQGYPEAAEQEQPQYKYPMAVWMKFSYSRWLILW